MRTGSTRQIKKDSLLDKWLNRDENQARSSGISRRPDDVSAPLSMGQQRLLFLQQLYPDNPFYNYADAYRFRGNLDVDNLIQSFELVAQRHEVLRTNFKTVDSETVQKINKLPNFEISRHDLRNSLDDARYENARKLAIQEVRKPFKLQDGPLSRISILRLAEEDFLVVLTMHHIIFDKWSMGILLKELAENYQKLSKSETVKTDSLAIQYADFAYWQSRQETDESELNYWSTKLENSLEFLDLPTDFRRPNRPSFRGAYSARHFSPYLSKAIRMLCRRTNATPYVLLLTAYKILLNRYTNETDILVGSPFTNRDRVELETLIGFFNDTLVLRSDLSGNPTFLELLDVVKQTTQDALIHKNMPFETLVKALKPERFLNYNPLFQTMFIYHESPTLPPFGDGLTLEHEPFDFGVAKFDLTLYIADEEETISGIFEYSKDLFDQKTVERMHGHLRTLLEAIVEDPNQTISSLPLLTVEETELLDSWNDTESELKAESVIELFEKQVDANPERTAVSFGGRDLTYYELNEYANVVANYLIKTDLDRKNPVGLLVESSIEMIAGIFGILKAGYAYLPIDATYPKQRIEFILKQSGTSFALTQKDLGEKFKEIKVKTEIIEEIIASEVPNVPLEKEVDKNDLAYVIYTSGSKGKPKGVSVTHENLVYSTSARFDFYPEYPTNFLLLSSFSFDSSMVGIFWTLTTGGKLVLTKRQIEQDLERLGEIFKGEKITHTLLLPALYSALLKGISSEELRSLDTVIVAGEACPISLRREHFETLPNTNLYNEYGPTEATVWATAHQVKAEESAESVPIGKPISNTQIFILDENRNRVPIGVWGEMYIGGKGLAKGYFNNPELTEKHFIANPFKVKERLYRTGDRCRFKADGTIEFSGRQDDQVKIRGYRIELSETQDALKQVSGVSNAVVRIESAKTNLRFEDEEMILLEALGKMSEDEAEQILKSVEDLSDKEIESMMNATERA